MVSKSIERLLDINPTEGTKEPPKSDPNELQATMRQAVRLTRWLCQEHYRVVCSYKDAASTDSTGPATDSTDSTDSTDMVALEEVILTKLKEKGPLEPRELQSSFHALSADDRDKAILRLKKAGYLVEQEDGRLGAAA